MKSAGCFALALLPVSLAAQQFALDPVRAQLPDFVVDGRDVELVDLDRDGDLDVLIANARGPTRLLRNQGHARFLLAPLGTLPPTSGAMHLALVDVDGDLDLDLHETGHLAEHLLRNDGGTFTDVTATQWPVLPERSEAAAFADLDGDGDADAWVGGWETSRLLENRGGTFVDVSPGRLPPTVTSSFAIAFADVDGDRDLDAFVQTDRVRLCLNDGTGRFTDVTATHVPSGSGRVQKFLCGDLDADGDADALLVVTGSELTPLQDRLLLNDGTGRFADATVTHMPREGDASGGAELGDVDGDSDLDAIVANVFVMSIEPLASALYRNDGGARFAHAPDSGFPTESHALFDVALGDLDGDADLDAVFACWNPCDTNAFGGTRLFLNDGRGRFEDATAQRLPYHTESVGSVTAGDVDGDGDDDLLVAHRPSRPLLLFNDGRGEFVNAATGSVPWRGWEGPYTPALFDVDGDRDLDAFIADSRQDQLLLNDGRGLFTDVTATHLPPENDQGLAVAHGDLDGDGDQDLVVGNTERLLVMRNAGGRFAVAPAGSVPSIAGPIRALLLVDVDRDGDLDVVLGGDARDVLLRNDGQGVLTDDPAALPLRPAPYTRALAAGDVDGDGDPDLVLGNPGEDRLYVNDGTGRFADASTGRLPHELDEARALVLADFDEDGDPDLLVSNGAEYAHEPMRLLTNDGRGFFADSTATRLATTRARGQTALPCDVDADGDLDVVLYEHLCCAPSPFCSTGTTRILINRHRQLAAPSYPARGSTLDLEFFAQPGYAQDVQLALPALSPPPSTPPVLLGGLGSFALDPNATIALPWLAVVAAPSTLVVPVPVDRSLSGASLLCQSLFVDFAAPSAPRLTNALLTRILN